MTKFKGLVTLNRIGLLFYTLFLDFGKNILIGPHNGAQMSALRRIYGKGFIMV
jgi:hypothetical protein